MYTRVHLKGVGEDNGAVDAVVGLEHIVSSAIADFDALEPMLA